MSEKSLVFYLKLVSDRFVTDPSIFVDLNQLAHILLNSSKSRVIRKLCQINNFACRIGQDNPHISFNRTDMDTFKDVKIVEGLL